MWMSGDWEQQRRATQGVVQRSLCEGGGFV